MELAKQYNGVVDSYITLRKQKNELSDNAFWESIEPLLKQHGRAIDFGCGSGDLVLRISETMDCVGVDTSSEMVAYAKQATGKNIKEEDFSNTSFETNSFDLVVSKWAMQTSWEISPIYDEASRLLKKGGYFAFLVVHPLRQFIEKKKRGKDYFTKEIVQSIIFDGTITLQEPSHTLEEYFSEEFLNVFSLLHIKEGPEFPAAEQIGGDVYPTYLIIVAQKK